MELPLGNPGRRVAGMGDSGGELFLRCSEGFGRKGYGLIGRGFGTFSIEGSYCAP